MKINNLSYGLGFLLLPLVLAPAAAQEVLSDPAAVRACLCDQQSLTALTAESQQQRQSYDAQRQSLQRLESEVASQRARLDPNQPDQVEAFTRLLDQRDAAQRRFADQTTPAYSVTVGRYNGVVAAFNRQCAGKIYAPAAVAAAKAGNFACPKP